MGINPHSSVRTNPPDFAVASGPVRIREQIVLINMTQFNNRSLFCLILFLCHKRYFSFPILFRCRTGSLQAFGNCNRRLIQQVIDEYVDQRYHQIHREKRIIVADELKTVTLRIPSATAASVCPLGTAFTPERSTSATTPAAETVTELHFTAGIHTGGQSEPDASPESYPVYEKVL